MTNFVSRPVIGVGTFITEYTSNPMLIVSFFSALNIAATIMIRQPEDGLEAQIVADQKVSDVSTNAGREPPFNVSVGNDVFKPVVRQADSMASDKLVPRQKGTPLPTHGLRR